MFCNSRQLRQSLEPDVSPHQRSPCTRVISPHICHLAQRLTPFPFYHPCPFILLTLPTSLKNPSLNNALHRLLLNSFFACPLLTCVRCFMLSPLTLFCAHFISSCLNADCRSRPGPVLTGTVRPSIGVSRRCTAARASCVVLASWTSISLAICPVRPGRGALYLGRKSSTSSSPSRFFCSSAASRVEGVLGVPPRGRWPCVKLAHGLGRGAVPACGVRDCDDGGGDDVFSSRNCEGEVLSGRVNVDATNCFRRPCGCLRALEGV
jgi:hypothetical protein